MLCAATALTEAKKRLINLPTHSIFSFQFEFSTVIKSAGIFPWCKSQEILCLSVFSPPCHPRPSTYYHHSHYIFSPLVVRNLLCSWPIKPLCIMSGIWLLSQQLSRMVWNSQHHMKAHRVLFFLFVCQWDISVFVFLWVSTHLLSEKHAAADSNYCKQMMSGVLDWIYV